MMRALLLAVLLLPGSCGDAAPRPLVGVILPLSGERAAIGAECRRGLAWFEEHGSAACRFVVADNRSRIDGTLAAFRSLADEGAVAVLGVSSNACARAAAAAARDLRVPFVALGSGLDEVTAGNPFAFCVAPRDPRDLLAVFGLLESGDGPVPRAVTLADARDLGSLRLCDRFEQQLTILQRGLVLERLEAASGGGAAELVEQILAQQPQLVFAPVSAALGVPLLRALGEELPGTLVLGFGDWDAPALRDAAGLPARGPAVELAGCFDAQAAAAAAFTRAFRERHGLRPTRWAALAADAARLAAAAVQRARAPRRSGSVRAALDALPVLSGVTGLLSFDAEGELRRPWQVFRLERDPAHPRLARIR